MKNIIYILLFIGYSLNAQTYFCSGTKDNIQELQVDVHTFHEGYESNYNCEKWAIQEPDSISNDWHLGVSKVYFDTFKPKGCRITKPTTIYKIAKLTSDGYYKIPIMVDEKTIMVQRIDGVPKKNIFNKTILIKK